EKGERHGPELEKPRPLVVAENILHIGRGADTRQYQLGRLDPRAVQAVEASLDPGAVKVPSRPKTEAHGAVNVAIPHEALVIHRVVLLPLVPDNPGPAPDRFPNTPNTPIILILHIRPRVSDPAGPRLARADSQPSFPREPPTTTRE